MTLTAGVVSTMMKVLYDGNVRTSLDGVLALGGLAREHDTVGTVENGVGDIRDLGTGRSGVVLFVSLVHWHEIALYIRS